MLNFSFFIEYVFDDLETAWKYLFKKQFFF